jgi:hypothetical protein
MRFVPIKSADQQALLMLHRTRDLLIRQRTSALALSREPDTNTSASADLPQTVEGRPCSVSSITKT